MRRLLAAALLLAAVPALAADPLAFELSKMAANGFSVRRRLTAGIGSGAKLTVVVFRDGSGEYDRLKAWRLEGGKAGLAYLELSSSQKIDLERLHAGGKLPDLYGDGSRTLAYRTAPPSGPHALHLVRFVKGRAVPEETPLPGGTLEDVDGDGTLEVVTRALPLGRLFTAECGSFSTMAQTAYRTSILQPRRGALVNASARHTRWYDAHIAQLEGDLAGLDPRGTGRYGDHLGGALSLYFDYTEKGMPRQGWARFNELFQPASGDPGPVRECISQIKSDLRRRLGIPDTWE